MNIYYRVRQRLAIGLFWRQIASMAIVPLTLSATGVIISRYVSFESWVSLGAGIIVFLAIYLPAFWIFSMNRYERDSILSPLQAIVSRLHSR